MKTLRLNDRIKSSTTISSAVLLVSLVGSSLWAAKNDHPCSKAVYNSASAAFTEAYKQAAGDSVRMSDLTKLEPAKSNVKNSSAEADTFLVNYVWSKNDGTVEDHSYRVKVAQKCAVVDVSEQ